MKKLLFSLLLFGSIALSYNDANAQKPLYRMSEKEITALSNEELFKRVVDGWGDMLLNINFGMKYEFEAALAFCDNFEKGMMKWSNSLTGRPVTNKDKLIFQIIASKIEPLMAQSASGIPTAIAVWYKYTPKNDIDTVLSLKAKAIEATDTLLPPQ